MSQRMEFIRGIHNLRPWHKACVASIGNYDGVHVGHQAVVRQVLDKADELQLPSLIMLFEPQPLEYFAGDLAPARLMRLRDKLLCFKELGVDRVLCLQFNPRLRKQSAEDFVRQILIDGVDVKYLVVGDDFRFGHDRKGNFQFLKEVGEREHFTVVDTATVVIEHERVSSTRVREELEQANFTAASKLLGRSYSIAGRVVHGEALGRTIGVPTANIRLHRQKSPLRGVYVVDYHCQDGRVLGGVANIGTRPTVNGKGELLEVHLLDFNENLYGQKASVTFLEKIRDEIKFPDLEGLKAQIDKDIEYGRHFFAQSK